jgi:chromosome segregation ATPase
MFELQDELDRKKEEFARREEAFRKREDLLREKDAELQESLIKFNKFLQENEAKRTRANKRAAEERTQREAKGGEITKLQAALQERIEEEKSMRAQLQTNEKYRRYLQSVVEQGDNEFHEISDLLSRYKTLKTANSDLSGHLRAGENDVRKTQNDYTHFKKETGNEILSYSNEIAGLQRALERAEQIAKKASGDVEVALSQGSAKTRELGQVLRAIANIRDRFQRFKARTAAGAAIAATAAAQKRAETKAREAGEAKKAKEGAGGSSNGGNTGPSPGDRLEAEYREATEALGDISEFMLDYTAIVEEWAVFEERKSKEARERTQSTKLLEND